MPAKPRDYRIIGLLKCGARNFESTGANDVVSWMLAVEEACDGAELECVDVIDGSYYFFVSAQQGAEQCLISFAKDGTQLILFDLPNGRAFSDTTGQTCSIEDFLARYELQRVEGFRLDHIRLDTYL